MNFKRINNIAGWAVCLIACAVYILTMEATGSLWDCGEFASAAYKLQIPHSPGAPFFVLVGRLFMAPFSPQTAATGINLLSALSSGFTILFLFWSITHFAKKILLPKGGEPTGQQIFSIIAAGVVGGLAYTFSDTFWYSAVEGEVYALSSFFTALLFWLMLKWEQNVTAEEAQGIKGHFTKADRWIVLIFFLMGLSIGVHLLNILVIPAIVMIYYFKRYKVTGWGTFWAFVIGCAITGIVQKAMIQWMIKGSGSFDVFFVNSLGLPFFSGFAFFFIFIAALIFFGLKFAQKKNYNLLQLSLWSFSFIMFGTFASYCTTLARSNANPALDMSNVDNPINLVSYLAREQYGDWPILYGQDFTAEVADVKTVETYTKSNGKYELNGKKSSYVYAPEDMHLFPRMWDASNDQGHADYYANWMGIGKDKEGNYERKPTMGENIGYAIQYQMGWMYCRYFLWNFAGKQNDVQGIYMSNVRDGNWKTGIGFWDSIRLGDQSSVPDSIKNNKANNKLYALPLILGLLGLFFQLQRNRRDALAVGLVFFFTGLAIVFYLNQAGNQPRERDYAFVGSFYAFAIWIGLGVLFVKDLFEKLVKNDKMANIVAAAVCLLAVPVLMASQEWDDHDRSKKTIARDLAINYLESCAPNAIVISYGDNDTYPLWYAQEVEGIRRDVRVINSSLLGTDWYIDQLRYKVNNSAPIDLIWTPEQIVGANRDVVYNFPAPGVDQNQPMDLYTMLKDWAGSDDPSKMQQGRDGSMLNIFPTKKLSIPVDVNLVRSNGTVNANDSVLSAIQFDINKNMIFKNDAAVLNIIAANKWKRPIYFTSQDGGGVGLQDYIRQDGLTFRLVPVKGDDVNKERVVDVMMNKFVFGGADKPGVYYDEANRIHLNTIRFAYAQAARNLAENNRKEEARKLLNKCDKMMLEENFPYGMVGRNQTHNRYSMQMLISAYIAEDSVLANKIQKSLKKDLDQQLRYLEGLPERLQDNMSGELEDVKGLLMGLQQIEQQFGKAAKQPTNVERPNSKLTNEQQVKPVVDSPKR
jgi:hypothetical protein